MDPILFRPLDLVAERARRNSRWQGRPPAEGDPLPRGRFKARWWQRLPLGPRRD